jgi:hypothetical protein
LDTTAPRSTYCVRVFDLLKRSSGVCLSQHRHLLTCSPTTSRASSFSFSPISYINSTKTLLPLFFYFRNLSRERRTILLVQVSPETPCSCLLFEQKFADYDEQKCFPSSSTIKTPHVQIYFIYRKYILWCQGERKIHRKRKLNFQGSTSVIQSTCSK